MSGGCRWPLFGAGLAVLAGCAVEPPAPQPAAPTGGSVIESPSAAPLIQTQDGPPLPSEIPPGIENLPDALPKVEPKSEYGNPDTYEVYGQKYTVLQKSAGFHERGYASWYGRKFHGKRTSSGEPYDMFQMTGAHKTLPLPCYARVTNLYNGKSVVLRINDRGPFHSERIIDVSYAAAVKLGMVGHGSTPVELQVIDPHTPPPPPVVIASIAQTPPVTTRASAAHPVVAQKFLQAGVFRDPINAATFRDQLGDLGFPAVQLKSEPVGDSFQYRVLVGPFPDGTALDSARHRLADLQITSMPILN